MKMERSARPPAAALGETRRFGRAGLSRADGATASAEGRSMDPYIALSILRTQRLRPGKAPRACSIKDNSSA